MNDTTYNGWTNYETWVTKLWIDNDQGSQEYWQEQTQAAVEATDTDDDMESRKSDAATELANSLESTHEENTPTTTGLYADLLNAAMGRIDWREIAVAMLDEIDAEQWTTA